MGFSTHAASPKNSGLSAFKQFGQLLQHGLKNLGNVSTVPTHRLAIDDD
jgi:hypothetical protein